MAYSGSQLKKIREERNIPLEQVATATRIRLTILQDLEEEEYSELSSTTQTKGFLKLYAEYLGLQEQTFSDSTPEITVPVNSQDVSEQNEAIENKKKKKTIIQPPKPVPQAISNIQPEPIVIKEPVEVVEVIEDQSESSEELMAIGRELAARRRYLNITWDVIEEETHIPSVQLKSIERGDLDAFTNPMQFKGHLQAYASFLNLDVTAIMIRYADAIQKRRLEKNSSKPRRIRPLKVLPPFLVNLKRFFTLDLFFGTLMILGILGFLIWGISQMSFMEEEPEITGTLPAVADVLLSEPTIISTEIVPTAEEEPAQILPTTTPFYAGSETDSNLEVVLLIRQNTWIRVTSDSEVVFEGRQPAGNVLIYTGEEEIELEIGNISAIEIIFNQLSVEPISDTLGTNARLLFTIEGMTELSILENDENP